MPAYSSTLSTWTQGGAETFSFTKFLTAGGTVSTESFDGTTRGTFVLYTQWLARPWFEGLVWVRMPVRRMLVKPGWTFGERRELYLTSFRKENRYA